MGFFLLNLGNLLQSGQYLFPHGISLIMKQSVWNHSIRQSHYHAQSSFLALVLHDSNISPHDEQQKCMLHPMVLVHVPNLFAILEWHNLVLYHLPSNSGNMHVLKKICALSTHSFQNFLSPKNTFNVITSVISVECTRREVTVFNISDNYLSLDLIVVVMASTQTKQTIAILEGNQSVIFNKQSRRLNNNQKSSQSQLWDHKGFV